LIGLIPENQDYRTRMPICKLVRPEPAPANPNSVVSVIGISSRGSDVDRVESIYVSIGNSGLNIQDLRQNSRVIRRSCYVCVRPRIVSETIERNFHLLLELIDTRVFSSRATLKGACVDDRRSGKSQESRQKLHTELPSLQCCENNLRMIVLD
jgi:hypothetical protein